ncbi:tyrosinase-like protein 2 [Mytilus galloprovincialis]|uniref:tyrosinase-like protein 2 n=1 Tax=Mytilus galloprovincialis TaxID=29158 RepID=UPI003F7BC77C
MPLEKEDMKLTVHQDCYWHPFKRVRRECRSLSKMERNEIWDAINALKKDKSKEPNVYDWFADFHTKRAVYSVHYGPNFFGWHRYYTLRFEELLRKKNPNITLCYWDSRLDDEMKLPPHTVMFSDKFLGNPWGIVKKGPFAYWKTIRGVPLERDLGAQGSFITHDWIKKILAQESHEDISEPTAEEGFIFEAIHNSIHAAIGGQMNDFNTSAQEPAFWIHHSFIDSVWEKFCHKMRSKGKDPQDDYVTRWVSSMQMPDKYMDRLTPMKNIDGYSHYFTKNIYRYEEYPTCENNCLNSVFAKCQKSVCVSVTKFANVKENDDRTRKYPNHLAGPLRDSKILSRKGNVEKWVFSPIKIVFHDSIKRKLINNSIKGCETKYANSSTCKQAVAIVKSKGVTYNGLYTDYITCDITIPVWTYAFVAIKNPELGPSQTYVSVTNKLGNACTTLCLSKEGYVYETCTGVIDATKTEPKIYEDTLEKAEKGGYAFDPLAEDVIDKRIKLKFVCY